MFPIRERRRRSATKIHSWSTTTISTRMSIRVSRSDMRTCCPATTVSLPKSLSRVPRQPMRPKQPRSPQTTQPQQPIVQQEAHRRRQPQQIQPQARPTPQRRRQITQQRRPTRPRAKQTRRRQQQIMQRNPRSASSTPMTTLSIRSRTPTAPSTNGSRRSKGRLYPSCRVLS